jgi:hypothetical protein
MTRRPRRPIAAWLLPLLLAAAPAAWGSVTAPAKPADATAEFAHSDAEHVLRPASPTRGGAVAAIVTGSADGYSTATAESWCNRCRPVGPVAPAASRTPRPTPYERLSYRTTGPPQPPV